jgi:molecular chaperone GrpE
MCDQPPADDPAVLTSELAAPLPTEAAAEHLVEYVVPPVAYDAVDTDDELSREEPPSPPPPSPDSSGRVLEAVKALNDSLCKRLDALQTLFDREIRAEGNREKIVDRLHAELQDYKQDLLLSTLRPIFIDLIQLHDDLGKMRPGLEPAEVPVDTVFRLIDTVQQGIEDILYRQGVEPFAIPDTVFDPRRQRAVATVATGDPDLNKQVAARHRKGFVAGEKVIRPEVVSVYSLRVES